MKIRYSGSWRYWYDPSNRSWWAADYDSDGNQIGLAIYAYSYEEIKLYIYLEKLKNEQSKPS